MLNPVIINERDGTRFEQAPGDTLLRAALRAGVGLSYECNSGGCGGCKFELLAGDVETLWPDAPGLGERDRRRGRHLACQCRALGDVTIKAASGAEYVPLRQPRRRRAVLTGSTDITHDLREFRFRAEGEADFLPGQFAMLDLPGLASSRAYSLANTPNAGGEWHFQIRRVPGGQGTAALFDALQPGAEIGLDGPYGVAYLRTGIVLTPKGGALKKMLPLFKWFAGGRFGNGRQWQSWISLPDEVGAIQHLLTADVSGPVNLTAPNPITNRGFATLLGQALGRPSLLPVPSFGPKLLLGGELANALLFTGQKVLPKVLQQSGYQFQHPRLDDAFRALLL